MIVLLYKRGASPDEHVLLLLERALAERGRLVFIDRHAKVSVNWAKSVEQSVRSAETVIAILSPASSGSEMLEYELETALDESRRRGIPKVIPVWVGDGGAPAGPLGSYLSGLRGVHWHGEHDDLKLVAEVLTALGEAPGTPPAPQIPIEPAGGAVVPSSPYYTLRATDQEFEDAIRNTESVILVKGPRQVGKTSLIGRGAELVDRLDRRQVSTDFQMLSVSQLFYEDQFMRLLAAMLARQVHFKYDFEAEWLDVFGPTINLDNFMRALLEASEVPLVWFMDEADRLFAVPFADDFFGLVRSWHNARARDPKGPWGRFTVVIGYATEARLFIRDLNQSPFNVGRHLTLKGFTLEQTMDLNERYGSPIDRQSHLEALQFLLAGQPFLTRRSLELLATHKLDFAELMETADSDDGPFADHLKRMLVAVTHAPVVLEAIRSSLAMRTPSDAEGTERLVAAGVLKELPDGTVDLACDLYTRYLTRHLAI